MSPARRSIKRRDWPRGLNERRPGYFSWVHPDGRELPIGRVPLAVAKNEAMLANQHVAAQKPGLIERMTGAANTIEALLTKMPVPANDNTARTVRAQDKIIRAALGAVVCSELTVARCAELIEGMEKKRMAQAVRSRLIAVCQRGQELGWMEANPAAVTRNPQWSAARQRLTLDTFKLVLAQAGRVAEWLPRAMMLALVSAQDRSTIASMERRMVIGDALVVQRSKTKLHKGSRPVAIPLALRLDAVGVSLADLVAERGPVLSPYLVHHVKPWGNAPAGSPVHPDTISHSFADARELAGITGDNPPTFHEIRSLSVRLYKAQGGVDTKALAGHTQDKTHALYQDARGVEPVRVRIG